MRRKANTLIKTMLQKGETLALAESMTCGLAAHQLATVKGTSEVLKGGIVCYHESVKCNLLRVPKNLIEKYSAESKEVTATLAENLHHLFDADIYAAVTGLASGGGSETKAKPVGTVFFTVVYKGKSSHDRRRFRGTPLQIRKKACDALYDFILKQVL
jgi:PncC family amidohydrolase